MKRVLRGYAKDKDGNLILGRHDAGPSSKDKPSPKELRTSEIWLGETHRLMSRVAR